MRWINRKRRLERYAKSHGVPLPKGFKSWTPTFGSAARELVRRVQARTWGAASATGKWDDRLALLVTPKTPKGKKALDIAATQVGVKEHPAGSNDGPRVREYQKVTGAYRAPWCGSFVAWCYREAGLPLSGFNTAYVPSYVESARRGMNNLRVVSASEARPGDLACFDWGRDGVSDHMGIVLKAPQGGPFTAIEGNTANGNDSNGGEVMLRYRDTSQVIAFIRVHGSANA